jgi:hypothetical protein
MFSINKEKKQRSKMKYNLSSIEGFRTILKIAVIWDISPNRVEKPGLEWRNELSEQAFYVTRN